MLVGVSLHGQQVIGSFPSMDGGFEGQSSISTLSSIGAGVQRSDWTVNNSSGTATLTATGGRSGPKYITFSATASRRLQSPTATDKSIANTSQYVVQFYYKSTAVPSNGQVGVSPSGTSVPGTYSSSGLANTSGVWTKVSIVHTSGSSTDDPRYGIGIIRFSAASANSMDIDDFVMYAGSSADVTVPNGPTSPSASANSNDGELVVSWTAASGGVDGGGYLVLRRANAAPTGTPNVNGIYAVGNTIGDATVEYIGTATSFTDDGLATDGTQYYYTIYTVDKAFNYSSGVTTTAATPLPVELTSFTASSVNGTVNLNWATATEISNYGFEVERSADQSVWNKIGFVAGNGNSNSVKNYSYSDNTASAGTVYYRLKQMDTDGKYEYSKVVSVNNTTPDAFTVDQNFPNPFNPSTTIRFSLANSSNVKVDVYASNGELVHTLANKTYEAGNHALNFDASQLSAGIYLYRITAIDAAGKTFSAVKKMQLIK